MKYFMVRIMMLAAFVFAAVTAVCAQERSKVEQAVNEIVSRYENTEGVDCMTLVKGGGLEIIKTALNNEFGKSFMKGVTSITVIDYSDASPEICGSLRKEMDVFLTMLQDFRIGDVNEFADNDYIRCFAAENDGVLSDFVIAIENGDSKTVMYMAGKIIIE